MKVFSIKDSENLGLEVCEQLSNMRTSGDKVKLGLVSKTTFSDGEFEIIFDQSIRGEKVFIIASTNQSSENNLMETLQLIRSAKESSASEINVIMPYFGYARQDRRKGRGCITAKLVADMLEVAGASHVITIDIHAKQIQGFFNFPSDNIDGYGLMLPLIKKKIKSGEIKNPIICSPDAGGYQRAFEFTRRLDNVTQVGINKVRPKANVVGKMDLVGDVEGKDVIIVDDMIDTAGTLCKAVSYLKEKGATSVRACITHPVLSGNAYDNINTSELDELITTNTISKYDLGKISKEVTVVSCAPQISEIIFKLVNNLSLGNK
jgi:ribose-phosphate pyrophosphokinase